MIASFEPTFAGVLLGWAAVIAVVVALMGVASVIQTRRARRWRSRQRRFWLEEERRLAARRGATWPDRESLAPVYPLAMHRAARDARGVRDRVTDLQVEHSIRRPLA